MVILHLIPFSRPTGKRGFHAIAFLQCTQGLKLSDSEAQVDARAQGHAIRCADEQGSQCVYTPESGTGAISIPTGSNSTRVGLIEAVSGLSQARCGCASCITLVLAMPESPAPDGTPAG